jgi:hypothetical protein
MKRGLLAWTGNVFIVGYALDAALSLVEQLLRDATGTTLLLEARNTLALGVLTLALLGLPALLITPRFAPSLFLPLVLSALWLNYGAAPLPLMLPAEALGLATVGLQLAIASGSLLRVRRLNSGRSWLLADETLPRPAFSLLHSLGVAAGYVFLLLPGGLIYAVVLFATWIQVGTEGFVSFDLGGVSLDDRRYERDDQEIRLIGMMHLGEASAYRDLVQSFVEESTVVLAEGVTDEEDILEAPLSYERAARALGLEPQEDIQSYLAGPAGELPAWPVVQRADVDLHDFSPETLAWLDWASSIWASDRPLTAVMRIAGRISEGGRELAIVEYDILQRRNEHLLGEIEGALDDYEHIVVPWGALHLPYIEAAIEERGFDLTASERRRLLSWSTVGNALF